MSRFKTLYLWLSATLVILLGLVSTGVADADPALAPLGVGSAGRGCGPGVVIRGPSPVTVAGNIAKRPAIFSKAAAQEATTITIWTVPEYNDVLRDIADDFQVANSDIVIEIESYLVDELRAKFIDSFEDGQSPDIVLGPDSLITDFGNGAMLAALAQPLKADFEARNLPHVVKHCKCKEGLLYRYIATPVSVTNTAFIYNPDLLEAAGYEDPPTTWDEVREAAQAVKDNLEIPGFAVPPSPFSFYGIQTAFGGDVFGLNSAQNFDVSQVILDEDPSVNALQWAVEMINDELMPAYSAGLDDEQIVSLFIEGQVAMILSDPRSIPALEGQEEVSYEIANIPSGPEGLVGAPIVSVDVFMISAQVVQHNTADAVKLFLTGVQDEDNLLRLSDAVNLPSALNLENPPPGLDVPERDPIQAAFVQAGVPGEIWPDIPVSYVILWNQALILEFNQDMNSQLTAGDALKAAANNIREQLGQEPAN